MKQLLFFFLFTYLLVMVGNIQAQTVTCSDITLVSSNGSFSDGSGSSDYENNLDCSWLISVGSGRVITLNFPTFNTELNDYVRVYDVTSAGLILLGEFSGSSISNNIISGSNDLFITFVTDGSGTRIGWSAFYTSMIITGFREIYARQLAGVSSGSVVWGDYDADGDLDILLTGLNSSFSSISRIYENTGIGFNEVFVGQLTGVSNSSVDWGDYDADGDLDILLSGNTGNSSISKIYRNTGAEFTEVFTGQLAGVQNSSVDWGDYDADGDLDILLTGLNSSFSSISRIYKNTGIGFTEVFVGQLTGVSNSSVAWGDYNADGYLDILLTGLNSSGSRISKIYKNIGTGFTEVFAEQLLGVSNSSVDWGDYDADGDLDILLIGDNISKIYKNTGVGFIEVFQGQLTEVSGSCVAWGDYDADGDLDILLTGYNNSSTSGISRIYENIGMGFTEVLAGQLIGVIGSVVWGDYDSDGDLDILLTGNNGGFNYISKIYENIFTTPNTAPTASTNLSATIVADGEVNFSWDDATDAQTRSPGLSYDIYIGTVSGVYNKTSGKVVVTSGKRLKSESGSLQTTSWNTHGLANDIYFWSVQAVDAGFLGSPLAIEGTFTINVPAPNAPVALVADDLTATAFIANWQIREDIAVYILQVARDYDFTDFVLGFESRELSGIDSIVVSNVSENSIYYYRLQAKNAEGTSVYSNIISVFNTLSITSLDQIVAAPTDTLTMTGTGFALQTYNNTISINTTNCTITGVNADGTKLTFIVPDGVLTGDTFKVESFGLSATAIATFTLLNITKPTGLGIILSNNTATLTWDAHTNPAVIGYNIYRGTTPMPTTLLTNVSTTTHSNTALSAGTNYYYRITAYDGTNESAFSKEVLVSVQSAGGTNVLGNMTKNNIWNIAGSPYNITGDVGVPAGFTLIIEPGVVVNYTGDFHILVFGAIKVKGLQNNPVIFNGNSIKGDKYMLEIRKTNLTNSNLEYVEMNGPQGAILQGLFGDFPQNKGTLRVRGTNISNTLIKVFASNTNLNKLLFLESSITNTSIEGNSINVIGYYPLRCVLSKLISNQIYGLNVFFSNNTTILNSHIGGNGSIGRLKFTNTIISNSSIEAIRNVIFSYSIMNNTSIQNTFLQHIEHSIMNADSFTAKDDILLTFSGGRTTINHVLFNGNFKNTGIILDNGSSINITNSTFSGLSTGVKVDNNNGIFSVSTSNFINSGLYHIENLIIKSITAQGNYWNSNNVSIIAGKIYDSGDDSEIGIVDFSNRLSTHNIDAPISSPQAVVKTANIAGGINITWSANQESDIAGYKVYFRKFTGYSFSKILDVGKVLTTNIAGLSLSDSVAVTAYDTHANGFRDQIEGNESWFAFAVTTPPVPVAMAVESIGSNDFTAHWNTVPDASSYRIDVATDNNFTSTLTNYNNLDVLDTTLMVTGLMGNTDYYYRVRAVNVAGVSVNSNVVGVNTNFFAEIFVGQLAGVYKGSVTWGDYDADGDLDILLVGINKSSFSPISGIYQNTETGFVEVFTGQLTGLYNSSTAWGDYDVDGDLDILLTGLNSSGSRISKIYQNTETGFTEVFAGKLTGVEFSSVAWGDYDADGDLDILLSGSSNSCISKIYRNTGTDFTEVFVGQLIGVCEGSVAFGDYDADGDLDILLTGQTDNFSSISRIYENTGIGFIEVFVGQLAGVWHSSVSWGDYDADSDLDILLSGYNINNDSPISRIYQNTGTGFTEVFVGQLTGMCEGSAAWGDYDADGDLDILLTGQTSNFNPISRIYENTGIGFTEVFVGQLAEVWHSSTAFGDYDADGDLDILLTGYNGGGISRIYENFSTTLNTTPSIPSNPTQTIFGNTATFTWDKATDVQTPSDGLSYNIYIGTIDVGAGTQNIRSAHADLSTSYRRIVQLGDIQSNSWTIKNLNPATYFWSVQAIDASYAGGTFSTRQTFTIISNTAPNSETDIIDFSLPSQTRVGAIIDATNHTVAIQVIFDTDLTAQVATFILSEGATAKIDAVVQVTGITANGFTNQVVYAIRAANGTTTQNWTVTVTVVSSSTATDIIDFSFSEQIRVATIDATNHIVAIEVSSGTDLTALVATFTLSEGSTATVGSTLTPQVSAITVNNFTNPVVYAITAQDGVTTQDWRITVNVFVPPLSLGVFTGVQIYPNPVTDYLNISGINKSYLIQLLNMSGRIIYSGMNERSLDFSSFSRGIYFLKITVENGDYQTWKIIKN